MDDEEEGMGAACPSLQAFAWMLFIWIMNVYMLASLIIMIMLYLYIAYGCIIQLKYSSVTSHGMGCMIGVDGVKANSSQNDGKWFNMFNDAFCLHFLDLLLKAFWVSS